MASFTTTHSYSLYKKHKLCFKKDLSFKDDNIYIIVGKNGSGKSSFAKLLSQFIQAFKTNGPSTDFHFLYNPQEEIYVPGTVSDNINLFIDERKALDEFLTNPKNDEALKEFYVKNILPIKDKDIADISGGQRQVVGLARTLLMYQQIGDKFTGVIFDEPMNQLELDVKDDLMKFFKNTLLITKPIIFITHDFQFVDALIETYSFSKPLNFIQVVNGFEESSGYNKLEVDILGRVLPEEKFPDWSFLKESELLEPYYGNKVGLFEYDDNNWSSYEVVKVLPFYAGLVKIFLKHKENQDRIVLYHSLNDSSEFISSKIFYYYECI